MFLNDVKLFEYLLIFQKSYICASTLEKFKTFHIKIATSKLLETLSIS